MTVKFSLAHLTVLGTTPLELIQIAADAGYDYASIRTTAVAPGEHVTPLAGDPTMIRRVSRRLADTGVQVLDVELARLGPGRASPSTSSGSSKPRPRSAPGTSSPSSPIPIATGRSNGSAVCAISPSTSD